MNRRTRPSASLVIAAAAAALVAGCGDDDAASGALDQLDAADVLAPVDGVDDGAAADTAATTPDTVDPGARWELPACDRACDRVTDCGVDRCDGWDWVTSGELFARCWASCDGAFEADVLAAGACAEVETLAAARLVDYADDCAQNPCKLGCDRLGACVVEVCPGFSPPADEQIAVDCAMTCVPEDVAWVLQQPSCQALVDVIVDADDAFAQQCLAEPSAGCPTADSCAAYADKVTGCMSVHCGEPIAPWLEGLTQAVTAFCVDGDECPSQQGVDYVLGAGVTCASDVLAEVGPAPPFGPLCDGSVAVSQADAAAGCEALLACPGTDWLGTADLCAVYLALRPDAAAVSACLAASDGCAEAFACVSEE